MDDKPHTFDGNLGEEGLESCLVCKLDLNDCWERQYYTLRDLIRDMYGALASYRQLITNKSTEGEIMARARTILFTSATTDTLEGK